MVIHFHLGMEVTVNFLSYDLATMAQIWLDGVNVQRVDTHDTSVKTLLACKAVSWQSGILPWESHTVTVVPIADPLNRPYAEWVYLHSFECVLLFCNSTVSIDDSMSVMSDTLGSGEFLPQ